MKTLLTAFVLLLSLVFISGCGSDYEDPAKPSALDIANGTDACVQNYFNTTLTPLINSCVSCHTLGGIAQDSNFTLKALTTANEHANYITLSTFVKTYKTRLVQKIDKTLSHSGGSGFGSETINALKTFTGYVNDKSSCTVTTLPDVPLLRSSFVTLIDEKQTLLLSAKLLLNRSPTSTESSSVINTTTLDAQLDAYMEEKAFYSWLKTAFNDILLVDKYLPNTDAIALLRDYNTSTWYADINSTLYPNLANYSNYGVSRAPLELIARVVENNESFQNILTANYVLVNPFSSRTYGQSIAGFSYVNDTNVSLYDKESFRPIQLTDNLGTTIPHAGLLTDIMILNRFPTSNTNLNRHRSYKINKWFLATDILALANRAISAADQDGEFTTPTVENPNCAVCHVVMDPIAGAMKNWDELGRYRYDATKPKNFNRSGSTSREWPAEAGPIGLTLTNIMDVNVSGASAMQWLAQKIVTDPRFVTASVHLFYQALTGREPLVAPLIGADDYVHKMQAFRFQEGIFRVVGQRFQVANFNAKTLIKELIKSPLFRAHSVTNGEENLFFTRNIGMSKLLTPKELDEKIKARTGYYWTNYFNINQGFNSETNSSYDRGNDDGRHYLTHDSEYHILYGGINSDTVDTRISTLNGLMSSIQQRMAAEMGCYATVRDLYFDQNSSKRLLFPYVDKFTQPDSPQNIAYIKQNIQYLHSKLLDENISLESATLDQTLQLFFTLYTTGKQRIQNGSDSSSLWYNCYVSRDPDTGVDLNTSERLVEDQNYTIRAWSGVMTYLLGDYKFLHNSAE